MFVEVIERMKELLLRSLLAGEHMYVINQQNVSRTVVTMKLSHAAVLQARNEFIHEALTRCVHDVQSGEVIQQISAYCMHQVCLSYARSTVDEKRIVTAGGHSSHRHCCGVRQLITGAHHIGIE